MNIEELITDLRARINPQYYDQIGTESYERHQCVLALESLLARIDVLRKDAERYRWLRDAGATFYTGGPEITDGSDKVHVCEFAMDAAIDAARSAK